MKFAKYEIWGYNVDEESLEKMSVSAELLYIEIITTLTDIRAVYEKMLDLSFSHAEELQYFELIYQKIDGSRITIGSFNFY